MARGWLDHKLFDNVHCERAAWAWLIEHAVWRRRRSPDPATLSSAGGSA
jgi:hypothetical protein